MGKCKIDNCTRDELQILLDTSNCYTEILQKIGYKSYSNMNYSKLKQLILDFELDETKFKENNKL